MADQDGVDPNDANGANGANGSRLPVPREDLRPVVGPSRTVTVAPVGRVDALVRAVAGAPLVAAAVVGATAAAAVSGAAAATRLWWPWLAGRGPAAPGERSAVIPLAPGVHVSYTHIEVHWPLRR